MPIKTYYENIPCVFVEKFNPKKKVTGKDIYLRLTELFKTDYFFQFRKNLKNSNLVLKPNMAGIYPKEVRGLTTSMEMIEGVILWLKNNKTKLNYQSLRIIESTSINLPNSSQYMFEITGLNKLARKYKIEIVDVKKDHYSLIKKRFKSLKDIKVSRELYRSADILINLPVLKGYPFSGCCKNLMGLLADPYKPKMHSDIKNNVIELAKLLRPTINIVDGTFGAMFHAGEEIKNLREKKFNLILIGMDPLATDFHSTKIWHYKTKETGTLNIAYGEKIGLGKTRYKLFQNG